MTSDVRVSPTVPVPVWSSGASAVTTSSSATPPGWRREVDHRLLLDADGDAAPHALLEARELDFDRVGAGADGREDEGAVLARHRWRA